MPAPASSQHAPNERRVGRYVLERELGRGGMGVVYRALDSTLERPVALKMILDPSRNPDEILGRFRREALAEAKLQHPGIVAVHDAGVHEDKPYIVMELVDGESLERLLARRPPPVRRIVELLREVALALEHAHGLGIVHRDVKPENILVDQDGHAHLTDFGLARKLSGGDRVTVQGELLGTPAYMAPEQAGGEAVFDPGPGADIYSLGAVLYRALAGRPPFQAATSMALVKKVMFDAPPPLREVAPGAPRALEAIAMRCLEKDPRRRYRSAGALASELDAFLSGKSKTARKGRGALLPSLAALAVLALGALAAGLAVSPKENDGGSSPGKTTKNGEKPPESVKNTLPPPPPVEAPSAARLIESAAAKVHEGDREGALALLARAIELEPKNALARTRRGFLLEDANDHEGALEDASRAIELEPVLALAWSLKAIVEADQKDRDAALADAKRAVDLAPSSAEVQAALAHVLVRRGENKAALAPATRAIELDPFLAAGYMERANARSNLDDQQGALTDATRAVELEPRNAAAWTHQGSIRVDGGDVEGGIADLTRAIELDPRHASAWTCRAVARRSRHDLVGAIADATRSIELAPLRVRTWMIRGNCENDKGEYALAIADYDRALELDPANRLVWQNRAIARHRSRDLAGAEADFTKAIELAPRFASNYIFRARVRRDREERADAVADYSRFLELAPKDALADEARKALAELGSPR